MARKKSTSEIIDQTLRIVGKTSDENKKKKVAKIAQRYLDNIKNSPRYQKIYHSGDEAYRQYGPTEKGVRAHLNAHSKARDTKFSRATYMGLAKANGVG